MMEVLEEGRFSININVQDARNRLHPNLDFITMNNHSIEGRRTIGVITATKSSHRNLAKINMNKPFILAFISTSVNFVIWDLHTQMD